MTITKDSRSFTEETYHDFVLKGKNPGLYVTVRSDKTSLPSFEKKRHFDGTFTPFKSREDLLCHEMGMRMKEQGMPPNPARLDKRDALLKLNYSARNVSNLIQEVTPSKEIRERLHLSPGTASKLWTTCHWLFNSSLNGYQFKDESGSTIEIRNAITSSRDKKASTIGMTRRISDYETGKTLAYTGLPNTREKALEQVKFIFESEMAKPPEKRKGLTENNGVWTLTYAVNSLLTCKTGTYFAEFDDKVETLNEQALLEGLRNEDIEIDGKKVVVKPLLFSQPFNVMTLFDPIVMETHSGKGFSKTVNAAGYAQLLPQAEEHRQTMEDGDLKEILKGAIEALTVSPFKLLPEEELFNRTLICHILGIHSVVHCKTTVDRTTLGVAVATVSHLVTKDSSLLALMKKNRQGIVLPHSILQDKACKELIIGYAIASHPTTSIVRTSEGILKGKEEDGSIRGFKWCSNPVTRMFPDRYTKESSTSFILLIKAVSLVVSTVLFTLNLICAPLIYLIHLVVNQTLFFNPLFFKPGMIELPSRILDPQSPYVKREGNNLYHAL
jgi:hypothetical protein